MSISRVDYTMLKRLDKRERKMEYNPVEQADK